MANIKPKYKKSDSSNITVIWDNITNNDICLPFEYSDYSDKTFHAYGDFGSGSITIQGSNKLDAFKDPDNGQWVTLTDFTASPLVATENTLKLVAQNPKAIRVIATGVTDVTVVVESNGGF